ncbi:hypothetical protein BG015_011459 [Linnemannia schmuckeri]|uniref:Arylamine N-acetyltransferase n=1 Tax=Linnemannia schmuckeri TaxID=64567 RepID=A0A9P5VEF8_9FUNG|nr:hypothetical protein BG015_011459 [Linnemannia schmuckeri]
MLTEEHLSLYFRRIGFDYQTAHVTNPSLNLLRQIQGQQLVCIPYEDLSLHWRPVVTVIQSPVTHDVDNNTRPLKKKPEFLSPPFGLATEDLFQKLVVDRRGGYCLELNILLGEVLHALGFEVVHARAKVIFDYDRTLERLKKETSEGGFSEEEVRELESFKGVDASGWETHQMLLVGIPSLPSLSSDSNPVLGKRYLVDVGLAKYSLLDPIELLSEDSEDALNLKTSQGRGVMGKQFRISRHRRSTIPSVNDNNDYSNYDDTIRWNLSVRMGNNSQVWFPYYTFLEKEASFAELMQIHYYMSRSPTSSSPPEPRATMPLLRPIRHDDAIAASGDGDGGATELIGQVSMQELKLTVQRAGSDGPGYFGIEEYKDGTVLVLAGDDQVGADSW